MANADINVVATTDTFDTWRTRTNVLITDRNQLRNAPFVKDNSSFIVANGEISVARTTNGTLLRLEGRANAYIGYNLEVGSNILVGNISTTQNIATGNISVSRNTSTGNLSVTQNIAAGNISVTQNTSTGNLRVTTLANVGTLSIIGFGPIIDSSGNWLGSSSGIGGATGSQGAQGTQGIGAQGVQGVLGIQGRQGTQGTSVQGAAGNIQGTQGTQGTSVQGILGSQGASGGGGGGSQGSQGTQGTSVQGAAGNVQGSQGTQGTSVQGAAGAGGGTATSIQATSSSTNEALYLVGVPGTLGTSQTIKACTSIFANASTGLIFAVDFSASSDARLKKGITVIQNSLNDLDYISGVRYFWADESRGTNQQIGVIAQDVERVIPEAVNVDHNGFKSVSYDRIIPLLIESIKELKARVEELEKR